MENTTNRYPSITYQASVKGNEGSMRGVAEGGWYGTLLRARYGGIKKPLCFSQGIPIQANKCPPSTEIIFSGSSFHSEANCILHNQ